MSFAYKQIICFLWLCKLHLFIHSQKILLTLSSLFEFHIKGMGMSQTFYLTIINIL